MILPLPPLLGQIGLMTSKAKTNASFPLSQFEIDGFNIPIQVGRSQKGGGIMLYVREDKCHLLLSGRKDRVMNVGNVVNKNSDNEKLLFFYENASFGYYIQNIYIHASRKMHTLTKVAPYMDI